MEVAGESTLVPAVEISLPDYGTRVPNNKFARLHVDLSPFRLITLTTLALMTLPLAALTIPFLINHAQVHSRRISALQHGHWINISPPEVSTDFTHPANNYGFNSVAVDPNGAVYVGTNYQGLWKSTDSGVSWTKVNTGRGSRLLDSGRLWYVAVDPFNVKTLYTTAGYGVGGILKSTDGGATWRQMFSTSNPVARQIKTIDVYGMAVDPYTPNHIIAAFHYFWHDSQDSGVIESTNGGATWVAHQPEAGWKAGNSVWFIDSHTWLLGTQGAGIWRTTDSGISWTEVYAQNISHGGINAFYRDPLTGALYLALWTQIVKSTDDGVSWIDITRGLPYAAYEAVSGDGTNLYTAPSFPQQSYRKGPWYTLPEGGGTWKAYNSQTTCLSGNCNGPVMMALDTTNAIVYVVNWLGGVWKLHVTSPRKPG